MNTPGSEADLVKQARDALSSDWSAATKLTAELRERFPDSQIGYQIGAAAARALRQFDEASAILTEAAHRFADQAWVASDQAWTAHARGDLDEARRLASALRSRFPQRQAGYQIGAAAARALRQFDEASAILTEAAQRLADQAWVASEQAWTAHARGDLDEARRLASALRSRFPQRQAGYQIGAAAARALRQFDEASAILTDAAQRLADQAWVASEQAWTAHARGDLDEARRLASALRSRFPQRQAGYQIGAAAARALRQFDEASAILTDAAQRLADQAWVASEQAWTAHARGDLDEARRLASALRSRFPQRQAGYQIGAAAARALRQFDEASAILTDAAQRLADQAWVASEQAWTAHARGDLDEARRLASALRSRFPQRQAGYQIGAAAARALRQFDEASAILTDAAQRLADQAWVASEQAWTAHARGDLDEAIQLTAVLRSRHPADPSGYNIGSSMLRSRNRLSEAAAVLEEAKPKFWSKPWFIRQSAAVANLMTNHADAALLIKALGDEERNFLCLAKDGAREVNKVAVVVGMHRAGTSLCAKVVNCLGFALGGPLLTPNFDNPDGFQEHKEIYESHEALLSHLGASWDTSWVVRRSTEESLQSAEMRSILDRLKSIVIKELRTSGGRWAFKDPRTACFLPAWTSIFDSLGIEPLWILAVRDPRAVAASLYTRNRIPLELTELLWAEHYLNALRYLGSQIACVVHYEKWFSSAREQLNTISTIIDAGSIDTIEHALLSINSELRHHVPGSKVATLGIAQEVYSWLCSEPLQLRVLRRKATDAWRALEAHAPAGRIIRPFSR